MAQLPRPTLRTHRAPALAAPGSQQAAEQHLAAITAGGANRKIAHREHGTVMPEGARPDQPAEWDVVAHWLRRGGGMPLADSGDSVAAEIVHSRWVVRCPHCPSASRVTTADPRFFCPYCGNDDSLRWHAVDFPPEISGIEELLSARPQPQNRNWHPGETLADLAAENQAHQVHGGSLPVSHPEPVVD